MMTSKRQSVAVIGAGIAGATVARALGLAGHAGHGFDKSRGPGLVQRLGEESVNALACREALR